MIVVWFWNCYICFMIINDKKQRFLSTFIIWCWEISSCICLSSSLSFRGTHFAHTWLTFSATETAWWALSRDTFRWLATDMLLSSFKKCYTFSVFKFITAVFGLLHLSSLTIFFASLKCFHYLNTFGLLSVTDPLACWKNWRVSWQFFQSSHNIQSHIFIL